MTAWIQTYTSVAWDLEAPRAEDVRAVDIAHSLARLARFTGHTRTTGIYSVAQHSLAVMRRVIALGGPPPVVLGGLLHDAHEAYLGDVSSPLGSLLPGIRELKVRHDIAIAEWAGISVDELWHPLVRQADAEALATEARDLLGPLPRPWATGLAPWEERTCTTGGIGLAVSTFAAELRARVPGA